MPVQNTRPTDHPQAVLQQIEWLAQNIVIARKRRKETQAQWAQRLGVSQPTMARIERGDPSVAMASYVMCMWMINPALGLADLIAPQNDMASLEREVARTRSRPQATRAAVQEASSTDVRQGQMGYSEPKPAKGKTAQAEPRASHVAREATTSPWGPPQDDNVQRATQVAAGLGMSDHKTNSTAAGLAALIAGHNKVRP